MLLAVLTGLSVATAARAENASRVALERFQEGSAHYDARRYEEARVAFLQAYALERRPTYLLHLAHAELRVGQAALAATHFATFLRDNPDAPEAERQEADIDFAAARTRVTEVTPTAPAGTEIWVDDVLLGKTPFESPIYVTPGIRHFRAKHGVAMDQREVEALPGEAIRVELLAPEPPAEAPPTAPAVAALPAPDVAARGGRRPVLEWFADTPAAWVGAGVTGAGLVVGTTFAFTAKTHFDRADEIRRELVQAAPDRAPCDPPPTARFASLCQEFADSRDTGETQRTVAIVGFALSGVAAAATVAFYFLDPSARRRPEAAVSVGPLVTDSGRGLLVRGRF